MADKTVNASIEILGKIYPIRCAESELSSLQEAANYLNQKMLEVRDSGKVINLERIAIISALNITHQFLKLDQQKSTFMQKINQRIAQIQEKIDHSIRQSVQKELIYDEIFE